MKSIVKKLVLGSACGLVAMISGEQAVAATSTSNLAVSATVTANCNIQAAPLGFPAYDPGTGASSSASADLAVDCTNNVNFALSLGAGLGSTNAYGNRSMQGQGAAAGSSLGYQLSYAGGADLAAGATFATATGDGYDGSFGTSDQLFTIDGVIPGSQSVAGGNYTDTVVATLTY